MNENLVLDPQLDDEALQLRVLEALETVEDPELGMNIVDLGLVYGLEMDEDGRVKVIMTLTSMGCPLAGTIQQLVREALDKVDGIAGGEAEIVWNPPWTPARMSKLARYALGFHHV